MYAKLGEYPDQIMDWMIRSGLRIFLILAFMFLGIKLSSFVVRRISAFWVRRWKIDEEYKKRAETLNVIITYLISGAVIVVAALMILVELNVQIAPILAAAQLTEAVHWIVRSGPRIVIIVVLMVLGIKLSSFVAGRIFAFMGRYRKMDEEYKKRADTLSAVIAYLISVTVIVVAALMILTELDIQIGPILAAAGVVGLAVGFGAQHLVQDVISGFFILLDDEIRVGDVVQVADRGGLVERLNLRMVVLRDQAGNVHYIRNGKIDVVTNMTKDYSRYVFNIGVAYREDVDEVIRVVKLVDEDIRRDPAFAPDILEPIEVLGLDQFADSAVIIKARIKTKPIKQWNVGREFNRRLKKKFDELDIEIPFPHTTLYLGRDKKGEAAPLNVQLNRQDQAPDGMNL
jgi:moderate conductance mechanosensitive channel